ncbi:MAG TPA: nitrogen fixation protein NifZ [Rhodocyclaceae bacterium]|nr:nitrogen fixation protein NifZ [Rhodocyclaceae bacterium]
MQPRWDYGDAVRITRNVRNDGTYPGMATGDFLMRRGTVGHVINVGTFLQDQIIYSVHFLEFDRVVGCREEELIGADEPWVPSRFEFREKVRSGRVLSIRGEVKVPLHSVGEVIKVVRDDEAGVLYHVHFDCLPGVPLMIPEAALLPLEEVTEEKV